MDSHTEVERATRELDDGGDDVVSQSRLLLHPGRGHPDIDQPGRTPRTGAIHFSALGRRSEHVRSVDRDNDPRAFLHDPLVVDVGETGLLDSGLPE